MFVVGRVEGGQTGDSMKNTIAFMTLEIDCGIFIGKVALCERLRANRHLQHGALGR